MRPTALLELRGIALDPAVNGGMIDTESALGHRLFQVAVAERIPQIPAHVQQDDPGFEVTLVERTLVLHERNSFIVLVLKQSLP